MSRLDQRSDAIGGRMRMRQRNRPRRSLGDFFRAFRAGFPTHNGFPGRDLIAAARPDSTAPTGRDPIAQGNGLGPRFRKESKP